MINKIKSIYFLKFLFRHIQERKKLKLLNYNTKIQSNLDISIDNYIQKFNQIKIEIIPINELNENEKENKFINQIYDNSLYHIYLNVEIKEIYRNYILKNEKVSKIIILIDKNVLSLEGLFYNCKCIKEIKFITFNRNNIFDMSFMFANCKNLIKLDVKKLKSEEVIDMSYMFRLCEKLVDFDVSNFKIENVKNMEYMFYKCINLDKLNSSNFRTENVINLSYMFYGCSKLKE